MQIEQRRVEKPIGWPGDVYFISSLYSWNFAQIPKEGICMWFTQELVRTEAETGGALRRVWRAARAYAVSTSNSWKALKSKMRKRFMHSRVREFWNTHPPSTASPFGRINLEPSQATASKHRSPHSVRVRIRIRVGWSESGATAKIPLHKQPGRYVVTYQVPSMWNKFLVPYGIPEWYLFLGMDWLGWV